MRFILILLAGFYISCNSSQKTVENVTTVTKDPDPVTYASTITQDDLKKHLYVYASDEFEGRETGKPGQKKAVDYIKSYYENIDVPAVKSDGDYLQKVPLEIAQVPEGTVTLNGSDYGLGDDVLTFSEAVGDYAELTYVGFGIEEGTYSDYTTIDVKDKLVLIKAGEPKDADGNYVLSGTKEKSAWGNMSEGVGKKSSLAYEKGAKGVLYYDTDNFGRYKRYFTYMSNNKSGQMSLKDSSPSQILVMLNKKSVADIKADIETDDTPKTIAVNIKFDVKSSSTEIDSENVAAIIKGSEKPDEYVIVSSHLDHIGMTADGQINNGADDDGSGTVALLEIAEAFKKASDAGNGPKRSIVLLHVTGEEKGLLGSQYYTDIEPLLPLNQTVANLNIDMIGRIDPDRNGDRNYIYLIGSDKLSTELHNLSEEINSKYAQLELDYKYNDENDPNRFYYRSDHYNFAKNNIPIIFYFNGTHEDYHRPGDTPDKINYDLLENRTRLIFHTAWEVANRENKVIVDKPAK